ncbi:MAG: penicillin-binding protein 2 [Pelagibacteraceae bacterium]|nr:penicillin-binding protein 2 [Pelagibacteraceae bacterium]
MLSFNSSNIASKTITIGRRMFLVNCFKAVVLFGIVGRLTALQVTESRKYKSLADKNRFRETKIAPPRGIIQDYFGSEIASNQKIYQLHIVPENTPNIDELFVRLKSLINLSDQKIFILKKRIAKQKIWEATIISDNLTWSEFSRLNLFLHELPGVQPVVSVARFYNSNSSAHVVGYVSEISAKDLKNKKYLSNLNIAGVAIGKTGLEASLDEEMLGTPGYLRYEVNAYGKRIKQVSTDEGLKGKTYRTTLDLEIQKISAQALENVSGAICVMDIYNGDIVSMVSSPNFNPNSFVHGVKDKEWKEIQSNIDKPMINKAVSGLYPPGSTIKTLTALSALENDIVSPNLLIKCDGYIDFYGEKYHCWKKEGHGVLNLKGAIKRSCDVYFYEVARKLGVDRLSETAKKFGLGKKVLKNFNEEKSGVVPNTKWKLNQIGKNWYLGETLHAGIGQGYFLSTPIQLCLMTAQLANGGFKINPRIIVDENDKANSLQEYLDYRKKNPNDNNSIDLQVFNFNLKPLFRNQENINFVKDAMFAATNEVGGTSYRSRHTDKKFMFAGKTGSSQIKRFTEAQREAEVKQTDIAHKERDHAWFVAFAPAKDPKYAISVLVEHGGSGSSAAAPVAKKVIKKIIERHEIRNTMNGIKIGENI